MDGRWCMLCELGAVTWDCGMPVIVATTTRRALASSVFVWVMEGAIKAGSSHTFITYPLPPCTHIKSQRTSTPIPTATDQSATHARIYIYIYIATLLIHICITVRPQEGRGRVGLWGGERAEHRRPHVRREDLFVGVFWGLTQVSGRRFGVLEGRCSGQGGRMDGPTEPTGRARRKRTHTRSTQTSPPPKKILPASANAPRS